MRIPLFAVLVVTASSSACTSSSYSLTEHEQPIIGGSPVVAGQIPSMALIATDFDFLNFIPWCGAAVVADGWILTAAHCIALFPLEIGGERPMEVGDLTVSVNQLRVSDVPVDARVPLAAHFIHPDFDPVTGDNDLALLRVAAPLAAPAMAVLTRAAERELAAPGRLATTAGWGATSPTSFRPSNLLRSVNVPIVDRTDCAARYAVEDLAVTDSMVCAGDTVVGGVDACIGDSGGPLFVTEAGHQILFGTTSFGNGCARPEFPGVYARTATAVPWINACISDEARCATADHALPAVIPELRCVEPLGGGNFRARFGYTSRAALSLAIPPGLHNGVLGATPGAELPLVFASGATADAFTATFRAVMAWWLIGPDGQTRVAVASFASPRC